MPRFSAVITNIFDGDVSEKLMQMSSVPHAPTASKPRRGVVGCAALYKQATPQQPVKGAEARGCKSHPSNWAVRDGATGWLSLPQGGRGKQFRHRTDGPK